MIKVNATATQPTDRYPSRVGESGGMRERTDPVLWGRGNSPAVGPLSGQQLARYDADGFLVMDGLIDADTVDACLDDISAKEAGEPPSPDLAITEPDGGLLRSLFAVHKGASALGALVHDERLAGVARQLLGGPVYVHQSRINLKRGMGGKQFPWHSDFETWHVEDGMPAMRVVSASVALTENRAWNGPLLLIAGSHRWFLSFPGRTPADNRLTSLKRQTYGVPGADDLTWLTDRGRLDVFEGGPGSVVFFDGNVMHASPDNITPQARTNAFFCFNSVKNALVEPFGGGTRRPEHLAARDFTPV